MDQGQCLCEIETSKNARFENSLRSAGGRITVRTLNCRRSSTCSTIAATRTSGLYDGGVPAERHPPRVLGSLCRQYKSTVEASGALWCGLCWVGQHRERQRPLSFCVIATALCGSLFLIDRAHHTIISIARVSHGLPGPALVRH